MCSSDLLCSIRVGARNIGNRTNCPRSRGEESTNKADRIAGNPASALQTEMLSGQFNDDFGLIQFQCPYRLQRTFASLKVQGKSRFSRPTVRSLVEQAGLQVPNKHLGGPGALTWIGPAIWTRIKREPVLLQFAQEFLQVAKVTRLYDIRVDAQIVRAIDVHQFVG